MIVRELELDLDAFEGPFDLLLALVLKEELDLRDVDLAGIVTAFLERFRVLLRRRSRFDFDAEVGGMTRLEQASAFLAVLELRRAGELSIEQAAPFAPIRITKENPVQEERTVAWTVRSA